MSDASASAENRRDTDGLLVIALARIKSAGGRKTRQREALLRFMINRDAPLSIQSINEGVTVRFCDMVTLYRCLNSFAKIGLVRKTFSGSGVALWEQNILGEEHFYVTCKRTNQMARIDGISSCELSRAIETVKATLASRGFSNLSHSVQIFGEFSSQID